VWFKTVKFLSPSALLPGNVHMVAKLISFPPMQVTKEDGGRLNAFATEPRMVVIEAGEDRGGGNKVLLIGGLALVAVLLAVAALISRAHA